MGEVVCRENLAVVNFVRIEVMKEVVDPWQDFSA